MTGRLSPRLAPLRGAPRLGGLGAVGLAVLLVGCTEKNPLYCEHDGDCQSGSCDKMIHTCAIVTSDGGVDGPPPMHCMSDMNCPTTQPHCMDGICRECVTSADCTGGKVCGADHACGACTSDSQCSFAGGACEDGMCPPASDVVWADCAQGCPGDGSMATPFCTLSAASSTGRHYVVMTPRSCPYDSARIQDGIQEIDGRGATVAVTGGESGIFVSGGQADVFVHDLAVTSSTTMAQNGIMVANLGHLRVERVSVFGLPGNASVGIRADTANLIVRKSLVYTNAGWGMVIGDTMYRIENSFILGNGSTIGTTPAGTGGVRVIGNSTGAFVYNTVAKNVFEVPSPTMPNGAGVECDVAANLVDSLLIENQNGLNIYDTKGFCSTTTGTITTTMAMPETSNDIFVDTSKPQESAMRQKGFHVKPGATMVIHKGVLQPSPTAPDDIDGDLRPSMTTPGADEPLP